KRKSYDQFGHAEPRAAGPGNGGMHYGWSPGPGGRSDVDVEDLSSMFDAFFGGRGEGFAGAGRKRRTGRSRVEEQAPPRAEHTIDITFMTAVRGGTESLRMDMGGKSRSLDVTIPKGITSGSKLRVRGGADGGDLILTVRVGGHPVFRRAEVAGLPEGLDLY